MDILKRSISNITDQAWREIDLQTTATLRSNLSARKFLDIKGPFGWDHAALPLGRISVSADQKKDEVQYGIHQVMPLVESRVFLELDVWELDNISRGGKDPDLSPLQDAARKIAFFEEETIYNGLDEACIRGLSSVTEDNVIKGSRNRIVDLLSMGVIKFREHSVQGPYVLVAEKGLWQMILSRSEGYPMKKRIEAVADAGIILSPFIDQSYMVSTRGGDMEMVIGQDYSVGYHSTDTEKIRLFITESFTFRVINPEAVVKLSFQD